MSAPSLRFLASNWVSGLGLASHFRREENTRIILADMIRNMATQSTTPTQEPNPLLIFEALNAYQRATALKAAIELEIFTHIGAGATAAPEIARRAQASEKGTRIICDFLTIQGFLTKQGTAYGLTPDSAVFL